MNNIQPTDNELYDLLKYLKDPDHHITKSNSMILEPSKKSIEKYPLLPYLKDYIFRKTPLLNDPTFEYSLTTRIYWVINHLTEFPKCQVCGAPLIHWNIAGMNASYNRTCCPDCQYKLMYQTMTKTMQDKYHVENPFQLQKVIDMTKNNAYEYDQKKKKTRTLHFGDPNFNNSKQACEVKKSRYGSVWNVQKCAETQQRNRELGISTSVAKNQATKRRNKTENSSSPEEITYRLLKTYKWPNVKQHYKSEAYPFQCDFYVEDEDLYIEYMGSWTHGSHPYDPNSPEDQQLFDKWKQKANDPKKAKFDENGRKKISYYDMAIQTWTIRDPKKRQVAKDNHLNYLELWSIDDVVKYLGLDETLAWKEFLTVKWDFSHAKEEVEFYKNYEVGTELAQTTSRRNYLVKYFQQDVFFYRENEMWIADKKLRSKLLENRMKYLNKGHSDISDLELLEGFTKSGILKGFSHFNPQWFSWFIKKYDVKSCYDPCGGWGHRMLGGVKLDHYIYNDISEQTVINVQQLAEYMQLTNVTTYCHDAIGFVPDDSFDAMFTCPPYFNVEKYKGQEFQTFEEFKALIDGIFDVFQKKTECKVFGLVMREDLLCGHDNYVERYDLTPKRGSYLAKGTQNRLHEYLYIFRK